MTDGATMKYYYLQSRDVMRATDEYHQCGKGSRAIWFLVGEEYAGKCKREAFSHTTRVRRRPAPSAKRLRQEVLF
jgi:hypothetical protein